MKTQSCVTNTYLFNALEAANATLLGSGPLCEREPKGFFLFSRTNKNCSRIRYIFLHDHWMRNTDCKVLSCTPQRSKPVVPNNMDTL